MNDWALALGLLTRFRSFAAARHATTAGPWLPVVGAGLGLVAWALMALCVWFGGVAAGAALAALVVFGFEGWITAGRRYGAAIRLLESIPDSAAGSEAAAYIRVAAFQGLLVLKLACYGVLAYSGHGAWMVVAWTLSTAGVAHAMGGSRARTGVEALDLWYVWGHWLVALAAALLAGRLAGEVFAALFALLVAWLLPGVLCPVLGPESREAGSATWLSLAEALSLTVLAIGVLAALAV